MLSVSTAISQFIEKFLLYRGRRSTTCRVYAPTGGMRTYSVFLEEDRLREQFYLDPTRAEEILTTGNEQYVLTEVRSALRNLDKQLLKRKSARRT